MPISTNSPDFGASRTTPQAQELRARIVAAALTFAEFGRQVGLSRNQLYKVLTNQTPSAELRKRIDHVLAQPPPKVRR